MNQSNQHSGKHILLIHQAFALLNEPGGTRHYEMAHSFLQHGHRVTVITSPVSYLTGKTNQGKVRWLIREEPEPGLCILRAYTYPALHRSFFHRLLSFFSFMFSSFFIGLGVKNVDVIWGTSPPIFQGWTAWLLAKFKRVKVLFEIRDLWPAFAIAMKVLKNPFLIYLSNWLEKFLYRHADLLVVNSPGFINHIKERGGKNINLVTNGVDPTMFDPEDKGTKFRQEQGLQDACIMLYAGAHGVSNDLEVILKAAALTELNPQIVYVLVGDGKEKINLMNTAREMHLNNIYFIPPVPKDEMSGVMAAADACIAILKPVEMYKTTYPNKVFDYMAAGRPVLCAIDGVIREVVETAKAGVFVPPGDPQALAKAVVYISNHAAEARQMGLNGRAYVSEHFNRAKNAVDMENLLLSLVKADR
ncbi:MAG: glycosyltransferase family 4 protein [Anaerolineaceae bacterium]|nr:glycosyltransferase family 4 protein [Anaerolineaceae bacterium]